MEFSFRTRCELDLLDITDKMRDFVRKQGVEEGTLFLFLPHATAGLITLENEPGLLDDFRKSIQKMIPKKAGYRHDRIDDNAHSHIRSSLLSTDLIVPINKGDLDLGTWQQIFIVELDNTPRTRKLIARVLK
jgi:secondary thiamine-phosphate synthase enzyme